MTSDLGGLSLDEAEREIYASIIARNPEHDFEPTLDRVREVCALLGDPQHAYRVIHVTGTNGKTSTARMAESLVREHGLRTGLFTSARNRPGRYLNPGAPVRPPSSIEAFEKSLADRGIVLDYTPVEEVAARVVDAVRAGTFWILPPSERTDQQIRARADSMLGRTNPTYIKEIGA